MTPGHDRSGRWVGSGAGSDDVADRVDPDLESEVRHPGSNQISAVPVRVGQGQPGRSGLALRPAYRPELTQLVDAAHETVTVDPELGQGRGKWGKIHTVR